MQGRVGLIAEMPLAHVIRAITHAFERPGIGVFIQGKVVDESLGKWFSLSERANVVGDTKRGGILFREDTSPGQGDT